MRRATLIPLALAAAAPAVRNAAPGPAAEPAAMFTGPRSHIDAPEARFVESAEELAAVWKRHNDGRPELEEFLWLEPPRIDFDRYLLAAVFAGDSVNARGYRLVETVVADDGELDDGELLVRYERSSFQTFGDSPDQGVPCSPWAFFVLPRGDDARVWILQENTQRIIGEPPVWTQRARSAPNP